MARKNIVPSFKMLDGVDASTNQTSKIVNVQNMDKAAIHVEWAGASPAGTITVEARNGENDSWYELDFGSAISVSGNSGDHQIIFNELPFTDIRLQYASSSGTGTLDATITLKQLGG